MKDGAEPVIEHIRRRGPRLIAGGAGCAAALLTVAMLAACGGASAPTTASTTSGTGTGTVTPTQTVVTTPATTTSTSPTAATPACTASSLRLLYHGSNGALGTIALYFAMRNISTTACHTYGYPGVLFLSRSGAALQTKATRTTHDPLGSTPVRAIVIAPGASAGFRLVANLGGESGSGAGCTTAGGLQAIPPDDTATLRVDIPGGVPWCGIATLSPLLPGSAVPPGT